MQLLVAQYNSKDSKPWKPSHEHDYSTKINGAKRPRVTGVSQKQVFNDRGKNSVITQTNNFKLNEVKSSNGKRDDRDYKRNVWDSGVINYRAVCKSTQQLLTRIRYQIIMLRPWNSVQRPIPTFA